MTETPLDDMPCEFTPWLGQRMKDLTFRALYESAERELDAEETDA